MSMPRLWLFLAVSLPVLASVLAPMSSVDLTYQLRAGGEIIDARAVPAIDTWTFTAGGLPWIDQQWAAQALLAMAYRMLGWTGLVLLRAGLTAVIFGATLAIARRKGLDERIAAVLTLLAFVVAAPAMALRPQLLGMACFAVVLLIVVLRRERPVAVWLVPLIVALWANLHGSFVLAPVLLGLALIEDLHDRDPGARRVLVVAVASVAAACISPFGVGVWTYAIGLTSNSGVTARTTEWQPTSLRDPTGLLFFASVAAVVVLLARGGRRVPWPALLWIGAFAAIGVVAQRGVAWWPLVGVTIVSGGLIGRSGRTIAPGSKPVNAFVAALVVVAGIVLLPFWRPVDQRTGIPAAVLTDAPPGITRALEELGMDRARILNPQRWGSWIEFAFPNATVAADSRIEFIPADVWARYEGVFAGVDGWRNQLEAWGVSVAITEPTDTSLATRLKTIGWTARYEDADGTVWIRPAGARR